MSKGKTAIQRVVLSKLEYSTLVDNNRVFPFDRITIGNIERFKLSNDNLRTTPNNELVILSAL